MEHFFQNVLTASFHGSIVILAVLALRLILRKAPKKFICWLWTLAGLRLLMPIPLQSPFSLQPQSIRIPVSLNLSVAMLIAWGVVAVVIGSYSIVSYIHLRRKVDDAVKVPGGWESDKIETAFVLGFIKPKIYIPTGMTKETRKQILAHERTHLDKGDHWIKMVGFLALALHWFNPLVWVSYILLCKDIEMACDERVVQFMELEERKAYSSALLQCSTNRAHYAACPVAFGEVSVKYRIKSVLNYRKPSFWLSLLCIIAIAFVAVCLMTSPETVVEVPVDPDVPLQEISREDPANFTPAVLPEMEPNPDWGVNIFADITSPTGGRLVYEVEERFAAASETIKMENSSLERWNGTCWEPLPSRSGNAAVFDDYWIGFAQRREFAVSYQTIDVDWTLNYGSLPTGDYRITQTVKSDTDAAIFHTGFHIYREELPTQEAAALERCATALSALVNSNSYAVTFSETDMNGNVTPVKLIVCSQGRYKIEHYLGQFTTASASVEEAPYSVQGWDAPYRLDQNRWFLFPEGQSVISQQEITFHSVWSDAFGVRYQGRDSFQFNDDGNLKSVERLTQTLDEKGNVTGDKTIRMEVVKGSAFYSVGDVKEYTYEDSFESQEKSPWKVFFRVDDDLLSPNAGEIWLGVDAIGVSNYTTDGTYWLEKKEGDPGYFKEWKRLGGEDKEASWGSETIRLTSQTTVLNVDWTADYGKLEPGVYRMGKHFYKGEESIIQYAEFAIYQTGGVFGEGGEEALARVDAAMDKLQSGSYKVEKYEAGIFTPYGMGENLTEVIWRYNDAVAYDFYNLSGGYSHTAVEYPKDGEDFHLNWWERTWFPSEYDSYYFADGQSVISDREIRFAMGYSQNTTDNPCYFYTYFFDENGNLTEMRSESTQREGRYTRYIVTETPEEEIKAWVEAKAAEQ